MTISARMRAVEDEIRAAFTKLNAVFLPSRPNKRTPSRPRPLDHKLAISVGRSIVTGIKSGWSKERTKAEATRKAKALAVRYGVAGLSAEFEKKVERWIDAAFQRGGLNAALRQG